MTLSKLLLTQIWPLRVHDEWTGTRSTADRTQR